MKHGISRTTRCSRSSRVRDVEYRAELTELPFSEEQLHELLEVFRTGARKESLIPNPVANWHVITKLSEQLLGKLWPEGERAWEKLSNDEIHDAARLVLKRNTTALKAGTHEPIQSG